MTSNWVIFYFHSENILKLNHKYINKYYYKYNLYNLFDQKKKLVEIVYTKLK